MCHGSIKVKAAVFFDIIIGMEGKKQEIDSITWKS